MWWTKSEKKRLQRKSLDKIKKQRNRVRARVFGFRRPKKKSRRAFLVPFLFALSLLFCFSVLCARLMTCVTEFMTCLLAPLDLDLISNPSVQMVALTARSQLIF